MTERAQLLAKKFKVQWRITAHFTFLYNERRRRKIRGLPRCRNQNYLFFVSFAHVGVKLFFNGLSAPWLSVFTVIREFDCRWHNLVNHSNLISYHYHTLCLADDQKAVDSG